MGNLPVLTELIVSIIGGVITAGILALFSRGGRNSGVHAGTITSGSTAGDQTMPAKNRSRGGGFAAFLRMLIAVCGGIFIALFVGRILIQAGLVPRGLTTRLVLLVAGTAFVWLVLPFGRGSR